MRIDSKYHIVSLITDHLYWDLPRKQMLHTLSGGEWWWWWWFRIMSDVTTNSVWPVKSPSEDHQSLHAAFYPEFTAELVSCSPFSSSAKHFKISFFIFVFFTSSKSAFSGQSAFGNVSFFFSLWLVPNGPGLTVTQFQLGLMDVLLLSSAQKDLEWLLDPKKGQRKR